MYFLYTLAIIAAFLAFLPVLVYRSVTDGRYRASLGQRFGALPVSLNLDAEVSIWIHAVSVGEALTVRALTAALRERYPHLRLFVSTTTLTGQEVARRDVPAVDGVFFAPFDLAFAVRRSLATIRPALFIAVETEIWPNLLRECRRRGVRTLLVNARISDRSLPRYRIARWFFRRVLADVDRMCAQSDENARRLIEIGADPSRVTVTGSLKFDSLTARPPAGVESGPHRVARYFRVGPDRPVIIAGSTLKGEELPILRAFERVRTQAPRALLVIAPRHPDRFDEVERLARDEGFRTVRRTSLEVDATVRADVVILDTIGELAQLYQVATAVFVGGSLVDAGGHNILEPAVFGRPILFGPFMRNFREIAETFLAAGAAIRVTGEQDLAETLCELLGEPERRRRMGEAASAIIDANRGARERTLAVIEQLLPPAGQSPADVARRQFRLV